MRFSTQHAPGADEYGYEDASERWLPIHSVESIVRPSSLDPIVLRHY